MTEELFSNDQVKEFIEYLLEISQKKIGLQSFYDARKERDTRKRKHHRRPRYLCSYIKYVSDSCDDFVKKHDNLLIRYEVKPYSNMSSAIRYRIYNLHNAKRVLWEGRIPTVMKIVLEFFPEKYIHGGSLSIIQEYLL
jgi:hypothetical protein